MRRLLRKLKATRRFWLMRNLVLDIITEDLYELNEKYADKRRTIITEETEELILKI